MGVNILDQRTIDWTKKIILEIITIAQGSGTDIVELIWKTLGRMNWKRLVILHKKWKKAKDLKNLDD